MAFTATNSTTEARAVSYGPYKVQLMTYTVASADTSGTITADGLTSLRHVMISGPAGVATAAVTYSGNVATIAFVDPAATRYGTIMCFGV